MSKPDTNLEQALAQLSQASMRPEAKEALLARMQAVHQASLQKDAPMPRRSLGRILPLGSAGRWAAAAAVLAAALGGLWWLAAGTTAIASVSFADVVRKVRQVATVRYEIKVYEGDRFIDGLQVSLAASGKLVRHQGLAGGNTVIYDFLQQKMLVLSDEKEATGTLRETTGDTEWIEPIRSLAGLGDSAGKACGFEWLAGRQTEVFEVAGKEQALRIWVDPQTELPVKVRITPSVSTAPGAKGAAASAFIVIEHIEWDCPLDRSLFDLSLPQGYQWASQRVAGATEDELIAMLRIWSELNDGRFPDKLDRQSLYDFLDARLLAAGKVLSFKLGDSMNTGCLVEGPWKELCDKGRLGLRFLVKVSDRDWTYRGAGVTLGDGTKPVAWWRGPDGAGYRAVYGDLSVRDLARTELPQAPPKE